MTGSQTQQVLDQRLEPVPIEPPRFLIDEQGGPHLDDDAPGGNEGRIGDGTLT